METKDIFGKRLLEIRKKRCESQQELADSIGITQQSLCRYEQGERTANIDFVRKVAEHYNVSADYFLGLSDVKSYDTNLNAFSKYTKLNEMAIVALKQHNEDNMQNIYIINSLISDGTFHSLVNILSAICDAETKNQQKYRMYDLMDLMIKLADRFT